MSGVNNRKASGFGVIGLLLALSVGCGPSYLETADFENPDSFKVSGDSQIIDNAVNRTVLNQVNKYRIAMTERDASKLRDVVAKSYYENASTTDDGGDDYGNERLEQLFGEYLQDAAQEIRYEIEVTRVLEEAETVHVDYIYRCSFRYKVRGREYWESNRDVNRLTFAREGDDWKISSGM